MVGNAAQHIAAKGFPWLLVTVEEVKGNVAIVQDQYERRQDVPANVRRGQKPKVGETWIIDRTLGFWAFAASLEASLPEVVGNVLNAGSMTGVRALLDALSKEEIIEDSTDDVEPPVVSGSTGGNVALRSLLNGLDSLGIINDTTTDV